MVKAGDNAAASLRRTPLFSIHEAAQARFIAFAGFEMPISYPAGIIAEHKHTRTAAGLFDVSHMGQILVSGENAASALETLIPVDIANLQRGRQRYGFFTNEAGGILDDLMIVRRESSYLLVVNASRTQEDLNHLHARIGQRCDVELLGNRALIALQGPAAGAVIREIEPATESLRFLDFAEVEIDGAACWVSRCGYTGEDGFEISCDSEFAATLSRRLLEHADVALVGLGARDSLRLEAGLCLYGNDIDTSTSPIEAGLDWAVSRSRRSDGDRAGGYPGEQLIAQQLKSGPSRRRVALMPQSRTPVRAGTEVTDGAGAVAGIVTSGGFGPSVNAPVAMGYVSSELASPGTALNAIVRGKSVPVEVAALPVVPHRYHKLP